ncbi:MAG: methylmalonyl-CoA mutase [Rhodocyclaceae bacterium]
MTDKLPDSAHLAAWEKAAAKSAPDGDVSALNWVTPEGITVKPLYTKRDTEGLPHADTLPGLEPFLRGPQATMYAVRPWTIRQYAGFSTAEGQRLLPPRAGRRRPGISVSTSPPTAATIPTTRASPATSARPVAIDSVEDMKILFDAIPLDKISVSMTMNGAVAPVLAGYIVAAEEQGVARERSPAPSRTTSSRSSWCNTYIYPPAPSMRIIADIIEYTWQRTCRSSTRSPSPATTCRKPARRRPSNWPSRWPTAEYVKTAIAKGMDVDAFAGRLSFFFAIGMNFYLEVAKLRAARLLWWRIMKKFGPKSAKSMMLRTHCQTSGWSLTEQDPYNNVVRTTVEAMAAVFGGTQSLHTNSLDEAIALPTDFSARIARNTQLIIQEETHITNVVDPWAGSYMMEKLTQDMADTAWAIIEEVEAMGGMTKAVESGWAKLKIEQCAAEKQARIDAGKDVIVGVNKYRLEQEDPVDIREIDNSAVRDAQIARLKKIRASRDGAAVQQALDALTEAAKTGKGNVLDLAVKAVRLRATVGEISDALEKEWGRFRATNQAISGVYGAAFEHDWEWQEIKQDIEAFAAAEGRRPRVMVAKLGQDGHDRGAKVVATALADLGFDIDIGPLFQTPEEAARQAIENDCHAIGVSTLAAGHKTLVPALVKALKEQGANDIIVFVGGVIPAQDYDFLHKAGAAGIFGPGTPIPACAKQVLAAIRKAHATA